MKLILFAREPELGVGKSRLALDLGIEKTYNAYLEILTTLSQNLAGLEYSIEIHWTGTQLKLLKEIFPYVGSFTKQKGQNLGEILQNSLKYQKDRTIIIGSDSPDIPTNIFYDAVNKLDSHDYTLGSTQDGGYYLLGFNSYRDYIFDDISWSTAFVYEETKSKIIKHNHTLYELPQWYDIDTLADYKKFKSKP